MNSNTFAIVLDAVSDAFPVPDFSDRAAVKEWTGELAGDCVDLVNNLGGREEAIGLLTALKNAPQADFESHAVAYCGGEVGKLGDGKLLERLKNVDWQKLISLITTLIALFPKENPAPIPTA